MSDERILPIVQGDWVGQEQDGIPFVGRVKQSWFCGDEVVMNVELYHPDGVKVGRYSEPFDGPKTFEPAVPFDGCWTRIQKPDFPLSRDMVATPSETNPGMSTLAYTYWHGGERSILRKPVRVKRRKQSSDYRRDKRVVVYVPAEPTNAMDVEIAGMLRSAQEFRTFAKTAPVEAQAAMRARADELEKEARRLQEKM